MIDKKRIKELALRHKECIPAPYDKMMDMDGFEAICAFTYEFGGSGIYVPKLNTIFKQCLEKGIVSSFNGKNTRELAKDYGVSERYIRNLIGK